MRPHNIIRKTSNQMIWHTSKGFFVGWRHTVYGLAPAFQKDEMRARLVWNAFLILHPMYDIRHELNYLLRKDHFRNQLSIVNY